MKPSLQAKLTADVQSRFHEIERLLMAQGYAKLPRSLQRACNGAAILRQELDPPKVLTQEPLAVLKSAPVQAVVRNRPSQEIRLAKAANRISRKRRRKTKGSGYFD